MAGDHLYVTNEEGHTYVLAPGREYKLLAQNELGKAVMATPGISDGVLYIRARKHLFAIGSKKQESNHSLTVERQVVALMMSLTIGTSHRSRDR